MFSRRATHRYADPLDAIWIACAKGAGLRLERGPDAYATTDGSGTLSLSDPSGMDEDDCLAQMILHEFCHALVQGPESFGWPDWGLENETGSDAPLEEACLRVQAALLAPLGLREVLAPTTDYRVFYDSLPDDPFEERSAEERKSIVLARLAFSRVDSPPYGPHLGRALEHTATLVATTHAALAELSPEATVHETPLLYENVKSRFGANRFGFPVPSNARTCDECAWSKARGDEGAPTCARANRVVKSGDVACSGFEESLECTTCGACCREAYDVVLVGRSDPALKRSLPQIEKTRGGGELRRPDGRCVALRGGTLLEPIVPFLRGGHTAAPPESKPRYLPDGHGFSCVIYDERPKTCRDFTRGSKNCLDARVRVGLTRRTEEPRG